ncbi:flagellar basal body-associated FliL family protein [Devosia nitrariae]|uniref:Flagellar protein FliL n=1 Tax=Devosia nitrariae TaxID=2071872 RepID=A0ABQ5WCK7_9HYPH|nr:flagellar basal body-associated FliL family protein [Devosia nitrariae]GLQ57331.1 flagellar basal body protein FliL [Devosia nitrariae]
MAADAEIQDGATDAQAGGGRKRLLFIIAGAALAVMMAGGGGLYYFLSAAPQQHGEGEGGIIAPPETFIFNLPTMTVNLNAEGDSEAFLRVTIALEVANEEMMHEIQPRLAKVIDAFQVYLRELRKSDLDGSAGIYRMKEELLRRVNVAIYPSRVESILFKELLVQ